MNELLINTEIYAFLDILMAIKESYDAGAADILSLFKGLGLDADEYYQSELEILYDSAEFVRAEPVYARNSDGSIDEDGEAMYEKFFFSSTDMTEYYRELYRLYRKGLISCSEYRQKGVK